MGSLVESARLKGVCQVTCVGKTSLNTKTPGLDGENILTSPGRLRSLPDTWERTAQVRQIRPKAEREYEKSGGHELSDSVQAPPMASFSYR